MRLIHVILAGWILITVSNTCLGKEWRGITPLKSSRADVERLLGHPTGPLPTYYLSDVTVTFWYSRCRCGDKSEDDCWDVPVGTVVSIYVTLKGVNRLADLGVDLSRFKKTQRDDDVPGSFRYSNAEEGFGIEGGGDYVSALIYGPRAKDEHLRCRRDPPPLQTRGNRWRGIVPLQSTRADVERLLGKPNGKYGRYEFENEWAEIFYSTGRCVNGWNVPEGTVISIAVNPTRQLRTSDLNVDLSNYHRFRDPHITTHVLYTNREEGMQYVVVDDKSETNGLVLTIYHQSTLEDERRLYCRRNAGSVATSQYHPFQTYGNVSFDHEKSFLDNFAAYLLNDAPKLQGYVVTYSDRRISRGKARSRARRAKDYLVKVRGVPAIRVTPLYAGRAEQFEVKLYALLPNLSPPVRQKSDNLVNRVKQP